MNDGPLTIEPMTAARWHEVRRIYEAGIATGNATFQTEPPTWDVWNAGHLRTCRLIARRGEPVIGWAALSPVSGRAVYAGVCEVSIYVAPEEQGRGIGRRLLGALIDASEDDGRWTLQAGIFPENAASVALHERCGFRVVGRRERLGALHGVWRDVLLLERRSTKVGAG